jgi:hypothetical protein
VTLISPISCTTLAGGATHSSRPTEAALRIPVRRARRLIDVLIVADLGDRRATGGSEHRHPGESAPDDAVHGSVSMSAVLDSQQNVGGHHEHTDDREQHQAGARQAIRLAPSD